MANEFALPTKVTLRFCMFISLMSRLGSTAFVPLYRRPEHAMIACVHATRAQREHSHTMSWNAPEPKISMLHDAAAGSNATLRSDGSNATLRLGGSWELVAADGPPAVGQAEFQNQATLVIVQPPRL